MPAQTIKVSLQSIEIPAINLYVHIISILFVVFLIKKIFGKEVVPTPIYSLWDKFTGLLRKNAHNDWLAHCRTRKHWPQKQDALVLDLKGSLIKSLSFSVTLTGSPQLWRAGFVLGNEKLRANNIIDTNNGITIHTGSEYDKKEKLLPIWKYYNDFKHNNPDFSSVKFDAMDERVFIVEINRENFMKVKVQGEVIFAQKIDKSFRRRVYLKAWADDGDDCKLKFKKIKYTLWS